MLAFQERNRSTAILLLEKGAKSQLLNRVSLYNYFMVHNTAPKYESILCTFKKQAQYLYNDTFLTNIIQKLIHFIITTGTGSKIMYQIL